MKKDLKKLTASAEIKLGIQYIKTVTFPSLIDVYFYTMFEILMVNKYEKRFCYSFYEVVINLVNICVISPIDGFIKFDVASFFLSSLYNRTRVPSRQYCIV